MPKLTRDEFRQYVNEGYVQYAIDEIGTGEVNYGTLHKGPLTESEKQFIHRNFKRYSVIRIAFALGRPHQAIFAYTTQKGLFKRSKNNDEF